MTDEEKRYETLRNEYEKVKARNGELEDLLMRNLEEYEDDLAQANDRVACLESQLSASTSRIEQLESACFQYKHRLKNSLEERTKKAEAPDDPTMPEQKLHSESSPLPSPTIRKTEDPVTKVYEYHKLPILLRAEGFVYGFRWSASSEIHIV